MPRMRPACGIPVAMQELEAALPLGIYMQLRTISVIDREVSPRMPSAVITFLLSAVFLALCEYESRIQIVYNI